MAVLDLDSLLVVPDMVWVPKEQRLPQVTLPQASVRCTEAMEQQLDRELSSLREQISMVSGITSNNKLCMPSALKRTCCAMRWQTSSTKCL